jgi:hypothetical protein
MFSRVSWISFPNAGLINFPMLSNVQKLIKHNTEILCTIIYLKTSCSKSITVIPCFHSFIYYYTITWCLFQIPSCRSATSCQATTSGRRPSWKASHSCRTGSSTCATPTQVFSAQSSGGTTSCSSQTLRRQSGSTGPPPFGHFNKVTNSQLVASSTEPSSCFRIHSGQRLNTYLE